MTEAIVNGTEVIVHSVWLLPALIRAIVGPVKLNKVTVTERTKVWMGSHLKKLLDGPKMLKMKIVAFFLQKNDYLCFCTT